MPVGGRRQDPYVVFARLLASRLTRRDTAAPRSISQTLLIRTYALYQTSLLSVGGSRIRDGTDTSQPVIGAHETIPRHPGPGIHQS